MESILPIILVGLVGPLESVFIVHIGGALVALIPLAPPISQATQAPTGISCGEPIPGLCAASPDGGLRDKAANPPYGALLPSFALVPAHPLIDGLRVRIKA